MKQSELIYWKGSGDLRSDLLQAIRVVGYELVVVSDIDDVLARPDSQAPGLVIVDASAGEAEASQRVIEMSAATALRAVPIIFLSYQATKRSAVLKKTFDKFLPVDIPFRLQSLLEQLLELCPVERAAPKEEAAPESIQEQGATAVERKPLPALTGSGVIREGDPTQLKQTFGGEFFALADRLERIDDALLLPQHSKRDEIIRALNAITTKSEILGLRARRVSFLASAIANTLGLSEEDDRHIRVAGMFLNWGLKDATGRHIKHDFFLLNNLSESAVVAKAFQNSARYVREKLGEADSAAIIDDIAKIFEAPPQGPSDELALKTSCALAPELADRGAWDDYCWDPIGAHRVVRKLEHRAICQVPKEVVVAMSRVLSEASATRLSLEPIPELPTEPSDDYEVQQSQAAQQEAKNMFSNAEQVRIPLTELKPGMRLSEPIIGVDGKLILKSNIELTEDLIHDIWRITTLRPVRPDVSVLSAVSA